MLKLADKDVLPIFGLPPGSDILAIFIKPVGGSDIQVFGDLEELNVGC